MIWFLGILLLILSGVAMAHPGHTTEEGKQAIDAGSIPIVNYRNQVKIEVRGKYRFITSNGIADHATGQFPNRRNPNAISAQEHRYRVPAEPVPNDKFTPMTRMPFGVALNGVPFDPGTAEYWQNDRRSGWRYEAIGSSMDLGLDQANAHVQPTGAYHYHGIPLPTLKQAGGQNMLLLGYAADGLPIYGPHVYQDPADPSSGLVKATPSYKIKDGKRTSSGGSEGAGASPGGKYDGSFTADWEYVAGLGSLDEANGRTGVTPEYPEGTYYYVLTDTFPYIPRYFRGTPDESFMHRGGGSQAGRRGPPPGRRQGDGPSSGPPPRQGDGFGPPPQRR